MYDTKVLSTTSEYFGRTGLGEVYEKCLNDGRMKNLLRINFDINNGFTNYYNSDLHEHYHEAAYDAYMTGYSFALILKYKEVDRSSEEKKQYSGKKPHGKGTRV